MTKWKNNFAILNILLQKDQTQYYLDKAFKYKRNDKKDLAEAEKKALTKLSKEVRVEGFRKGKAPADVAKKFIPENDQLAQFNPTTIRVPLVHNEVGARLVSAKMV